METRSPHKPSDTPTDESPTPTPNMPKESDLRLIEVSSPEEQVEKETEWLRKQIRYTNPPTSWIPQLAYGCVRVPGSVSRVSNKNDKSTYAFDR
eukprot:7462029-Pyramimonas_sp.AAC.1